MDKSNPPIDIPVNATPINERQLTVTAVYKPLQNVKIVFKNKGLYFIPPKGNGPDAQYNGNFVMYNKTKYNLIQFHYHCPSEHTIGGKHYDCEVHLVHKKFDPSEKNNSHGNGGNNAHANSGHQGGNGGAHQSSGEHGGTEQEHAGHQGSNDGTTLYYNGQNWKFAEAFAGNNGGNGKSLQSEIDHTNELLVVGLFVQKGDKEDRDIFNFACEEQGEDSFIKSMDFSKVLDAKKNLFYHYEGGLTTPPCSEKVEWIVKADPIIVKSDKMSYLKGLVEDNFPKTKANNRDIQKTNGRMIGQYGVKSTVHKRLKRKRRH
eukprot:CAMPEP_0170519744 /NCGR_PEP_ID=MMETSP0209-20121228/5046_1 /TAXON_ID=665100 ORGANISM="Litonotus pictus, Strain P1" /NCGR_SAMPLE_ID=MMETSP0209 /ASSEMBLY_ACC=CAM_ASM_000301 /LENGTH=316 /DNA_ID=CAMNT_0010805701 /DNA_START=111 /DNA_END=1057 /DNA_ORIENTATION=-